MDDALLVGMLHGVADLDEQSQPLLGAQTIPIAIAVFGDRNPLDKFHDKVRPAGVYPTLRYRTLPRRHYLIRRIGEVGALHLSHLLSTDIMFEICYDVRTQEDP